MDKHLDVIITEGECPRPILKGDALAIGRGARWLRKHISERLTVFILFDDRSNDFSHWHFYTFQDKWAEASWEEMGDNERVMVVQWVLTTKDLLPLHENDVLPWDEPTEALVRLLLL